MGPVTLTATVTVAAHYTWMVNTVLEASRDWTGHALNALHEPNGGKGLPNSGRGFWPAKEASHGSEIFEKAVAIINVVTTFHEAGDTPT